jgi:DNA N-6-adenine-methyltransferase (Dam)
VTELEPTHPFISSRETRVDHWSTPKWLLELIFPDDRFFDPCPIRGETGLLEAWPIDIPVFINPPYSNPVPWIQRGVKHQGEVVLLVRADPSTSWWAYSESFKVTFIGQRLRFGSAKIAASFPSAVWRKKAVCEEVRGT